MQLVSALARKCLRICPGFLLVDETDVLSRALLMGAGWVINLAVAEWIIRRRPFVVRRLLPH